MALTPTARLTIVGQDRSGPAFSSAIRGSRRFMAEAVSSGRAVERATGRMQSSMSRFMRFMGQQLTGTIRSFFYGLRMGVVGAGVAVSAFVATSLKSFRDFDKKLRETTALIAGASTGGNSANLDKAFQKAEKSYKSFYSQLLRMAPQMRRTPQDLAGGAYELVQAGIQNPKQAMRLLRPAAMGATAGGGQVDSSARVLVQIMNALRMGTTKPGAGKTGQNVMDKIFQAINLGVGVDFNTLSTGIGKFIGSAGVTFKGGRNAGMGDLNQLLATYIFSTQQGARTQDVGVGIQDVIKTIANPSAKGAGFAKDIGLGKLGSGFLREHGFVGSLTTIIQKMKDAGYTGAKLNDAIGKLFGDVRGRRIVAYATNIGMVNTALRSMGDSAGATDAAFQEQGKSLDAAMQKFKAYWETLKISLGSSVAPFVRSGMDKITGVLTGSGAIGRGQDIISGAEGLRGARRKRYFGKLSDSDMVAYQQAQHFNSLGFGGKIQEIGKSALNSFQAWWNSPIVQARFQQALHSLIQRSFDTLGRAIQTIPSIYKFGLKMGGEILRGTVDGFKKSIKSVFSGGGGGGIGGGNPLGGISSDPYQAITGLLFGGALAKSKWGGSPLGRGVGVGGGALLAGLDPTVAAMLGLGGLATGIQRNRKGGARIGLTGTAASTSAIKDMMVTATTVVINARTVTGGGGGGGMVPIGGGSGLRPGFKMGTRKNGQVYYQGPGGKFVSESVAMQQALSAEEIMSAYAGTPAAAGKPSFFARMRGFGARPGVQNMAMAGMMAAPAAATGQYGAAIGGLAGAATFFIPGIGPAIALPASMAGSVAGSMIQDHFFGSKPKPTPAGGDAFARLMAPTQGTPKGIHFVNAGKAGGMGIKTPGGVGGFGAKFGAGGGFDWMKVAKQNIAGFAGPYFHSARLFYRNLSALMATPLDKDDLAQKRYEAAYTYGATSQVAMDMLEAAASEWHNRAIEYQAAKAERITHAKDIAKNMAATSSSVGRPAPRGALRGVDTGKYSKTYEAGLTRNIHVKGIWKKIGDDSKKPASDAGAVGPNSFSKQFNQVAKDVPKTIQPTIQKMVGDIWGIGNAAINGVGQTAGPSAGAPPASAAPGGGGSTPSATGLGGPMGGKSFLSSSIRGDSIGGSVGEAMGDASAKLAKKMADHAADAITKKQLSGPMGGAYKALQWLYRQVGKPYIWGGGHPPNANLKGYDCSGLSSTALMVAGSKLSGTTFSMIPNTSAGGGGPIHLGFNDPVHPTHMGINVMGKWFEARGHATPILGPGKARTQWPYVGVPKMHTGGVYNSGMTRGEGPAILKDGEMVVRNTADGGLQAHPVSAGGGYFINGPLIGHATIRNAHDVHHLAQELVDLLEKRRQNSTSAVES